MKRVLLTILGVLILCVIALIVVIVVANFPTFPSGPSADERSLITSQFVANKPILERIVGLETSYSGPRAFSADSVWYDHHRRVDSLVALISLPTSPRGGRVLTYGKGPIFIATWRNRGNGFEAPWWYAGYVHAPQGSPGSVQGGSWRGRYKQIVGDWWLFSVDDPEGREGPKRKPSRAAKIEW